MNHEDAMIVQGRRIRALHEIISRPDLSFDEQIDETLRLGCKLLGCEIGKIGRQVKRHARHGAGQGERPHRQYY